MKLHYGWMIVAAGALMTCVGMGAVFSLPVFLQPITGRFDNDDAARGTAGAGNPLLPQGGRGPAPRARR